MELYSRDQIDKILAKCNDAEIYKFNEGDHNPMLSKLLVAALSGSKKAKVKFENFEQNPEEDFNVSVAEQYDRLKRKLVEWEEKKHPNTGER